jgi:hypothetical protein
MEADWEVEIGADAPVIDVDWPGRLDIQRDPYAAFALPETKEFSELAEVLIRLNAAGSGLATSKCDVWDVDVFDGDELDAPPDADCAVACYVDLVPEVGLPTTTELLVAWCGRVRGRLQGVKSRGCRADLVVRRTVRGESSPASGEQVGVTAYVTGCGNSRPGARAVLGAAVTALANCVLAESPAESRR